MRNVMLFILAVSALSCGDQNKNNLTGEWLMYKVIQSGADVTSEHNPYEDRYLILKDDHTFESGGRPYGQNTGKYQFNATEGTLFLDSDSGNEDDSYWKVRLVKDTMYWQGYASEWAKDFQIIQVRKPEEPMSSLLP